LQPFGSIEQLVGNDCVNEVSELIVAHQSIIQDSAYH